MELIVRILATMPRPHERRRPRSYEVRSFPGAELGEYSLAVEQGAWQEAPNAYASGYGGLDPRMLCVAD